MVKIQFKDALMNVANNRLAKDVIGYKAEREIVGRVCKTVCALIKARRNRQQIAEGYEVQDYELPAETGLSEMANLGKIYLYSEVVEITDEVLTRASDSVLQSWETEYDDKVELLTPKGLEAALRSVYKALNVDKTFVSIHKENKTLSDIKYLYCDDSHVIQISDGVGETVSEFASYALGLTNKQLSKLGTVMNFVSEDTFCEWLFGAAAVKGSVKEQAQKVEDEANGLTN
jgi:hypothetical protein